MMSHDTAPQLQQQSSTVRSMSLSGVLEYYCKPGSRVYVHAESARVQYVTGYMQVVTVSLQQWGSPINAV